MIEIHTKLKCECGQEFHAVYCSTTPLAKVLQQTVKCPTCGKEISYEYHFDADFKCLPKSWQFWKDKRHWIDTHFAMNEGNFDEEIYPRKCYCGHDLLLRQQRIR